MENVVSIVNTRENPLEFDISIQGVVDKDTSVKFVIETNPVHFSFLCHKGEGDKWVVNIPPLPHIERVSYPFHIEIVVDGYYFEPYSGTLIVTAEPEVKATDVHKTRPAAPIVAPVVKNVEVQEDEESITDDEFKNLAEKIINKHKEKKEKKAEKPERKTDPAKEKAIKEAIEQFKNTPLKVEKPNEVIEESGAKKAYSMGLDDGKNSRPKKKAEKSFGDYANEYYKGYEDGKAAEEHEAWKEKTAAKRTGRDYHESTDEVKPRKSNLAGAIEKLEEGPELSEQAKRVRDIVNTTKH